MSPQKEEELCDSNVSGILSIKYYVNMCLRRFQIIHSQDLIDCLSDNGSTSIYLLLYYQIFTGVIFSLCIYLLVFSVSYHCELNTLNTIIF